MVACAIVIQPPVRASLSLLLGAICLVALTALTGSSDAVDPLDIQDQLAISSGALDGNVIGQTFTFHFPRLDAIQVAWIVSNDLRFERDARVTLHLRAEPNDTRDLATAFIPLGEIENNAFSKFAFPPLPDSENQTYYFFISFSRNAITRGSIALWSSVDDSYPEGALQINGAPTGRDLAFRAYYEPDPGTLAGAFASTFSRFAASASILGGILLFTVWLATRHSSKAFSIALALGGLLAFGVALVQIRDLVAPLWVDSLTHARYIQFLLEHSRLPAENFYHLGFHVIAALATRLFNLSIPQSLLLVGQFIWVLVGPAVFVLSRKISGSAFAGLVAAICVWFLSPTPAYFITWGRYPLMLGGAILPIALVCAVRLIQAPRASAQSILLAATTFAALAFSQIRLAAFYLAFVVAYFGTTRLFRRAQDGRFASLKVTMPIIVAFIFLFALMWLGVLWLNGVDLQKIVAQNATQPSIDLQTAMDVAVTHHGPELWLLAAFAIVVGIARRSHVAFLMLAWFIALGAITLFPPVIGELVPPSLVVLMAFLPAAIVVGDTAQFAYERWGTSNRSVHALVGVATLISVSLMGARDMASIANPATILFTRADEDAMRWINAYVPAHSKFLVNSFNWYGAAFTPSDGGGWIPYFTDNSVEYLDASAMKRDSESILLRWIESHKINYVYVGTRAGMLNASDFLSRPERFPLIYDRDGIRIFQVRGGSAN